MTDIVGIDLGTTNSLIGVMEYGFPILLADENNERITPSVVHFPLDGDPIVGRKAIRARVIAPERTVYSVKRLMGVRYRDALREKFDYEIAETAKGDAAVRLGDRLILPEEISAIILEKLKVDAERALGRSVQRAVVTVPAYFNDAQRNATKRAAEIAGLKVERIVNEPTAAALAYGLDRANENSTIAVYDLGGGTFDISILQLREGIFQVLATNGNTQLGGDDIDRALLEQMAERGLRNVEGDAGLREKLIEAKHHLSTEKKTSLQLPFFAGKENFEIELTRSELNGIARPIVEKTRWHCARALADARIEAAHLDEVILVGGVTRMPLVREIVREIFGRAPNVSQNPDEAVALGATIQAGILGGVKRDVILLDVTPLSLGIETFGGLMNVIIPRNSTIPIKAGEMFTTAVNNQRAMKIKVLQGEREMARDNWLLGEFEIAFEAAAKGVPRVGVQFEIDANGILHVLARDTKGGAERELLLKSAVDVSDEAVEQILSESLEHAFDDMSERAWTEAKLKADEMLAAVTEALGLAAGNISSEETAAIENAIAETRDAIASKSAPRLQQANLKLDARTQNLATIVLRKAVEQRAG